MTAPIDPFALVRPVWPLSDRGLGQRLIDLALLPFVAGQQPFARQASFSDFDSIEPFVPQDVYKRQVHQSSPSAIPN